MENERLNFLLDLIDANSMHAYLSVMEFKSLNNNDYNRIELIVANVGRLCLYQRFEDTQFDEQRPVFKIFYSSVNNINERTVIKNSKLLAKAVNIIYKCKRYCESHPQTKILNNGLIWRAMNNNEKLLQQSYEQNKRYHQQRWFDDFRCK